MSLRSRIALTATLLVLAAILVNTLLQTLAARQAVLRQARAGGDGMATVLARAAAFAAEQPQAADASVQPRPAPGQLGPGPALRRLVGELVTGDVREIRILDPQLSDMLAWRLDDAGLATEAPLGLPPADVALARDCIASGRPVGRFVSDEYRVAAPVRHGDGRADGVALVAISTRSSRDVLWWQATAATVAGLIVGLPGAFAALWLVRSIADPVWRALNMAEAITAGDLTVRVPEGGRHEMGRFLGAFGGMTRALGGLIGRIQSAGERLTTVEAEAAAALTRQDKAVRSLTGSAQEISGAVAAIASTSEQLLEATGGVTGVAREAARVADEGRGGLDSMTASMQQLDEAMNAFTRKLGTISQRASGITAVVTTISKVAEQTNLLSVNATIEAEKAGESGRGFRIVASEIRRLADQTALATKDIERMVRDMQAAVSSGTMEMDRFRNEVSARIGEVAEVSAKLGQIIEPVQSVTRSLETVHQGMEAQSAGARRIRDSMETLRADAGESAASLAAFTAALDELRRSIGELNAEAARFRT